MKQYIIKIITIVTLLLTNAYGLSNPEPMRMNAVQVNNNQDCSDQYDCASCAKEYSCEDYGATCCDDAYDKYGLSCTDLETNNWDCSGCSCNHPEDQLNIDNEGNFISKFGCMDQGNHPESNFPNGCTPGVDCIAACNYDASFMFMNISTCLYPPPGDCDCAGKILDECGQCGGQGKIFGDSNCCLIDVDECGQCGGGGIAVGTCNCAGNILDECGECGGDGIAVGTCNCAGNILDECGQCGGDGIIAGTCDCAGNIEDCAGLCGGSAKLDECGVCNGDGTTCIAISGCTYTEAINYKPDATKDDGSCEYLMGDINQDGTLDILDVIRLTNIILTGNWFSW